LSPSQTTKNVSLTTRFFRSMSTLIGALAPSPPVPAHRPRMSRSPARETPIAAERWPVGDLAVADLHHDRVDDDRRVRLIERAHLPVGHLLHRPCR
jgi:hypothetical protein